MEPQPPVGESTRHLWAVTLHGLTRDLTPPEGPALPESLGEMDTPQIAQWLDNLLQAKVPATCEVQLRLRSDTIEYRIERTGAQLFASVPGDPNRSNLPVTPQAFADMLNGVRPRAVLDEPADNLPAKKRRKYRSLKECKSIGVCLLIFGFMLIGWSVKGSLERRSLEETVEAKPIGDSKILEVFRQDFCKVWVTGEGHGHRRIELSPKGEASLYQCSDTDAGLKWVLLNREPYEFQQDSRQAYAVIEGLGPVHLEGHTRILYYGDTYSPLTEGLSIATSAQPVQ
ncbi:MAG: hypothetical protein ACFBZ8_01675 [Opitutales bacterium]